jgi:hypothetical protein
MRADTTKEAFKKSSFSGLLSFSREGIVSAHPGLQKKQG